MKNLLLSAILYFVLILCGFSQKKYESSWESLTNRELSEWVIDAKFGIYAHWGIYSVPAFGNEWYAKRMYDKDNEAYKHHVETYGDPSRFGYKDFIPMFKAENFDPAEWADLIAASGAKYAGIAVVHHDGFLLWDSKVNPWNVGNMGPKRDLYGDLVTELRKKKDMKIIATEHHIRTFDWYLPQSKESQEEGIKAKWDIFNKKYSQFYWNHYTGNFDDFIQEWKSEIMEVIDKYQPDLLWFDGGNFQDEKSQKPVLDLLSYYMNRGEEWGKKVEVLNKLPTNMKFNFPIEYGLLTFEEGRDRPEHVYKPWIDDQKISTNSWGYIKGQTYKTPNEIVDGFIDRVARGGGLLLSLCPLPDGTLNQPQKDILIRMGKWLDKNGEAIFATRPWKIQAEGDESVLRSDGNHGGWKFINCDASQIRFTMAKDKSEIYAIALDYPEGGKLKVVTLNAMTKVGDQGIDKIIYLGSGEIVRWTRDNVALYIELPEGADKDDLAYAFRIIPRGKLSE